MSAASHFTNVVIEAARRHIPLDVSIELTNHCNFRCAHCYIPDFETPDGLSTGRIFSLLDELTDMGTLFLTLTGGEPLLRRDWGEIARRARQLGFHVMLLTNGSLIDDAAAELMAQLMLQVRVSFHGADAVVFERVTRKPGSFEQVLVNVKRLVQHHVDVELTVPLSTLNYESTSRIRALADKLHVDFKFYTSLLPTKDARLTPLSLRLPPEERVPIIMNDGPVTGCSLSEDKEGNGRLSSDTPLCAAGTRFAAISASGDVRGCPVLPGVAGNINDTSFREIWETSPWFDTLRNIRRKDLRQCAACSRFAYCGRCPALALVEDGDLRGPSSAACAYAEALEAYVRRRA